MANVIEFDDKYFYSLRAIREMLSSEEKYKIFLNLIKKRKSLVKPYFFINSLSEMLIFEKVYTYEGLKYGFKEKNLFHYFVLHDPYTTFSGNSRFKDKLSHSKVARVNLLGFFQIDVTRLPIRANPQKFVGFHIKASDGASYIDNELVSRAFYCSISRKLLKKYPNNILLPEKAITYPYFQNGETSIQKAVYFDKEDLLQVLSEHDYTDINILESNLIYKDGKKLFPDHSYDDSDTGESKAITLERSLKLIKELKDLNLSLVNHINKYELLPKDDELLLYRKKFRQTDLGNYIGTFINNHRYGLSARNVNSIFTRANKYKPK